MVALVLSPKRETVTKVKSTVNKDRNKEDLLHWQRRWLSCKICFHLQSGVSAVKSCLKDNNLHNLKKKTKKTGGSVNNFILGLTIIT